MSIQVTPNATPVRPGVQIAVNTDSLSGAASDSQKKLVLLGTANGGVPGQIYQINTLSQAKQYFRSGDLVDAIEMAFSPTSGISSGQILAERVSDATQSSFTNNGLSVKSLLYSADANNIQLSLLDNPLNHTKTMQVYFPKENYVANYTNLGNIFALSYNGSEQYASVEIVSGSAPTPNGVTTTQIPDGVQAQASTESSETGNASSLILKAGADQTSATVAKTFDLTSAGYQTTSDLMTAINQIDGFAAVYNDYGAHNIAPSYYDAVPETKLGTTASPTQIQALGGDIVNSLSSDAWVNATYDASKGEPDVFSLTPMTGAHNDTGEIVSWSNFLSNLSSQEGYYIVPLTDDVSIQGEAMAFAIDRGQEGDFRTVFVGGGVNETYQQVMARANSLRTTEAKIMVNATSGSRLMNNGTVKDLPGYIIAAGIAGLASGLPVGDSIKLRSVSLQDIDQKYSKDQLDALTTQGIIALNFVRNGSDQEFVITDDVTTAKAISDDPTVTELANGEASDYIVSALRRNLTINFLGHKTNSLTAKDIKASVISFLMEMETEGLVQDYSESDIFVSITGDTAQVSMVVVPSRTLNHIYVTLNYTNETLTA